MEQIPNWILETHRKKLDIRINYFSQILGDQYNKEDLCRLDAPYCLLVLGGLTLGLSVGGEYFIFSYSDRISVTSVVKFCGRESTGA